MENEIEVEVEEIELTPPAKTETPEARAERLFQHRHHLSSKEAFTLLGVDRPGVQAAVEALIQKHDLSDMLTVPDRIKQLTMKAVGLMANQIKSEPDDIANYVLNPQATVVSLFEMHMPDSAKHGIWGNIVNWELAKHRVSHEYTLSQYQRSVAENDFMRGLDEEAQREKIPLYQKPLTALTRDDFTRLYKAENFGKSQFTSLVVSIALFQQVQASFASKAIVANDLSPDDRRAAIEVVGRLFDALKDPRVVQTIAADPKARAQAAKIAETLGLPRQAPRGDLGLPNHEWH